MRLEIEARFGKGILGRLHEKAMNDHMNKKHRPSQNAEVFVYPHKLCREPTSGADEPIEIKSETILIWVDLMPGVRFSHPTEFILVSAEGTRIVQGSWWPTLNGKDLFEGAEDRQVSFPVQVGK